MKPDTSTQLVLDRLQRHARHGPAMFSMSSEDAQRVMNWIAVLALHADAGKRVYAELEALRASRGIVVMGDEIIQAAADNGYDPKWPFRMTLEGWEAIEPGPLADRPAHGGYPGRARLAGKSDGWNQRPAWGADSWRRYAKG